MTSGLAATIGIIKLMKPISSSPPTLERFSTALHRALISWWEIIHFGAQVLVLMLSPSTYNRINGAGIAKQIVISTWQVLAWFTILYALLSLVLIRIVVVTAFSYGLSQYALEMVVRVLVLELIPLSAALMVVIRSGISSSTSLAAMQQRGEFENLRNQGIDPLRSELLPRVISMIFAVLTLAAVSCVVALILAYLVAYGLSPWGIPGFTRMVGRVFNPAVSIGFAIKVILFSVAVGIIPVACALQVPRQLEKTPVYIPPIPYGMVRLFLVLLLIESMSLVIKYI